MRLSAAAEKRLTVMQTLDALGAGFTLACHDLDIRGAGNLLGDEQSGHIREVGIELYQQMLEDAVAELRAGEGRRGGQERDWTPNITLGLPVLIPEDLRARPAGAAGPVPPHRRAGLGRRDRGDGGRTGRPFRSAAAGGGEPAGRWWR